MRIDDLNNLVGYFIGVDRAEKIPARAEPSQNALWKIPARAGPSQKAYWKVSARAKPSYKSISSSQNEPKEFLEN